MFKIPLLQNKEALVAISLFVGLSLVLIVNILLLAPVLIEVYSKPKSVENTLPIDTEMVNKAVKYLE